jgi:hypothetical protein
LLYDKAQISIVVLDKQNTIWGVLNTPFLLLVGRLGIGRAEPFYPQFSTLHKSSLETLLIITY